jgi:hypothetical protein
VLVDGVAACLVVVCARVSNPSPDSSAEHLHSNSLPFSYVFFAAAMPFVNNNEDLQCTICDTIYSTANSAFVLSCSGEGLSFEYGPL